MTLEPSMHHLYDTHKREAVAIDFLHVFPFDLLECFFEKQ